MITLLAFRSLLYRPWRSLLLFLGYGMGVAVMIVLLSIGEALLTQARDEKLVGGGNITVLPEGLDIEVMKTGGIGGLFFSIDHSRFVYRQILASPRFAPLVRAVAPQIDGKLLYVRTRRGRSIPVRAVGEIPDATRSLGAAPELVSGRWTNDLGDTQYVAPTDFELRNELDHFHLPPANAENRETWAEWHYFNVVSPDKHSWVFISYIVAGDPRGVSWGGRFTITVHDASGGVRRYAALVPAPLVRFSTTDANLRLGDATVTVLQDGRYELQGTAAREAGRGPPLSLHLFVQPAPRAYFPGASLGGSDLVSGYVVPGLRADASGSICEGSQCTQYDHTQSYHDHNWGIWHGVTWDWGASRAGPYTILYGRVIPPDSVASAPPLFVYLVDSLGFRAVFRPREIKYTDGAIIQVNGKRVRVPSVAEFADARGDDTLRVRLDIENAIGTDTRAPLVERGKQTTSARDTRPYFIQMKGSATISGRVGGDVIRGAGTGFFETYR
ncbi:MAG: hypothetical protein ACR2M1_17405 [Gemmatimonadaceae bacterium]